MPNRSKDDQTKCGPLVLGGGGGGWWVGLRADTLSHKTLLLQKPKADKIHFQGNTVARPHRK